MKARQVFTLSSVVAMGLNTLVSPAARATPSSDAATRCQALATIDFGGVIDAPTKITDARWVKPTDSMPAHCVVIGYVHPRIAILLAMPTSNWNGKFLQEGCGGLCGGNLVRAAEKYADELFSYPLSRRYAHLVFASSGAGAMAGAGALAGTSALWAYNDIQGQFDFGIRAAHVAALAGKAIVESLYGSPPAKSYFSGCSSGGQQGLSEAQRFPWDFDGILVGAPSPTFSGPMMNYLWASRALFGNVNRLDLELVHAAALAQCDMDDGVRDGIISDPIHCPFDPQFLLCKPEQSAGCLTMAKVQAIKKVYSGPTTSQGIKIYSGGPLPGSELNWLTDELSSAYLIGGSPSPWPKEYFSYIGFMPAPGPGWKLDDFDFDRDYKRLRMAESLFGAADNPDLRRFKAAGGKMIMYQGAADESDIPADAIDYYETAEKTMGGRPQTQDFFRFFLVPGMNHCDGGAGAYAIDYLNYLEAWVEKGQAPDVMIGSHPASDASSPTTKGFTRPVYPYPVRAKYRGTGDPSKAESFVPVESR
jgi:hypothetical protein